MEQGGRIRGVIRQTQFSTQTIYDLLNRDAALWIGEGAVGTEEQAATMAKLVALPWKVVLCEDSSAAFAATLERDRHGSTTLALRRGLVDVIARDPEDIRLPPRSLPVFLLNGRGDARNQEESNRLSGNAALRRRLNMVKQLLDARPRLLVVLSAGRDSTLANIRDLWGEGFRSILTYVTATPDEAPQLDVWCTSADGPPSMLLLAIEPHVFAEECIRASESQISDERVIIRYRAPTGEQLPLDVTGCEQPEFPILDRYELIQARDLPKLLPEDLSQEDINSFFSRASSTWRPYAAGLPWPRDREATSRLMEFLETVEHEGCEGNKLLLVQSEPGAGGSTFARTLAFEAASAGYPTFVAKQAEFAPVSTELTSYLFKMRQAYLAKAAPPALGEAEVSHETARDRAAAQGETPALLVYDVQHWRGREQHLAAFVRDLVRESRPAVVLCVVERTTADGLRVGTILNSLLTHQMSREEVAEFGTHINKFLAPQGRGRAIEQWVSYWNAHTPRIGDFSAVPASFWVALEFWLKFQVDLGQSIQGWLYTQVEAAKLSPGLTLAILEIAALSVERHTLPETLLPRPAAKEYPYSVQLEDVRREVPSLGLVRLNTTAGNQWGIAHSLLARYLINGIFADREKLRVLELEAVSDPIALRLELLRRVATRPELATTTNLPLAVEFATTIFKLDRDGNWEFFSHWRTILDILEEMPDRVWDTSRTFNHHVAISRRRVVTDEHMFPLSLEERNAQADYAIEHLTYALDMLAPETDGERDLNLLNSLARTYQDKAEMAVEAGESQEKIDVYRRKATECIRRAQEEDPNNSFVLETLARDLLQAAATRKTERVRCVCEALMYVNRALGLESGAYRQERLLALVQEAMPLLSTDSVPNEIMTLWHAKDPIGCVAAAWVALYRNQDWSEGIDLRQIPRTQTEGAITILDEIPPANRTWLDLKLKYDLVCVVEPQNYSRQLDIVEELRGTSYKPDIQQQVEYAILLYQNGRYIEGSQHYREVRREIAETQAFVVVPDRLRYLVNKETGKLLPCTAVVKEEGNFRSKAYVKEFGKEWVPFIPRDWGKTAKDMRVRMQFSCSIVFGPNGPFARPVPEGGR